jgi:hypothetical protein
MDGAMDDLARSLAAMDAALTTLERTIDRNSNDADQLPNLVALLATNVRAQRRVLRAMVERIGLS